MKILKQLFFPILILSSAISHGQSWSAMDTGIYLPPPWLAVSPGVLALQEYNNTLYAGGDFVKAGSVSTSNVAQWNGALWDSVSVGNSITCAYQVYNGKLVAGGIFSSYLTQWDGTSWSELGSGTEFYQYLGGGAPVVFALALYHGDLVVGGKLDSVPGTYANNIAYWNGVNWNTYGLGLTGIYPHGNRGAVSALTVYNGNLIAAGYFDSAGGNPALNIAMWNGVSWSPLGSGINGAVYALAVYNGNLYAGGYFDSAGGNPALNLAMWNGSSWSSVRGIMNDTSAVDALTAYNGYLFAGGSFDTIGGIAANSIAYWDGSVWKNIGNGITGAVKAIVGNNNTIYVAGVFDTAGGNYALNVAMCSAPTGIGDISKLPSFNIFPDPNNGKFTIDLMGTKTESTLSVEIYNVLGEKVYKNSLSSLKNNFEINLSNQPGGVYLYRLLEKGKEVVGEGKFVIEY